MNGDGIENMNMPMVGEVVHEEEKEKPWNCCSVCKMKVRKNEVLVFTFST
jgi:hypothetical protein